MDYRVSYRAPACRGDEYTTVFEVEFADGTVYGVGGSVACGGEVADAAGVVKACWADAQTHVAAMGARLDAAAKRESAPVVDLSAAKVPDSVELAKGVTAAKVAEDVAEAAVDVAVEAADVAEAA